MKLPLVIGHRGVMGIVPENSVSGFKKAVELGIDGVELDVHLTRDKKLVVIHDKNLNNLTGPNGNIKDFTYKELKEYDISLPFNDKLGTLFQNYPSEKLYLLELFAIGQNKFYLNAFEEFSRKRTSFFLHWNGQQFDVVKKLLFPKYFGTKIAFEELKIERDSLFELQGSRMRKYSAEPIPLLEEVLEITRDKLFVNIEIKEGEKYYPGIIEEVIKKTRNFRNEEILFSCFDRDTILLLKKRYPDVLANGLCNGLFIGKKYVNNLNGLNPYYKLVKKKYISYMHNAKKTVYVWTINHEIDMLQFILYGVDGIISNYPQILKKVNEVSNAMIMAAFS